MRGRALLDPLLDEMIEGAVFDKTEFEELSGSKVRNTRIRFWSCFAIALCESGRRSSALVCTAVPILCAGAPVPLTLVKRCPETTRRVTMTAHARMHKYAR